MQKQDALRLLNALKEFEDSGKGDVKNLQGRNGYRLRVGNMNIEHEKLSDGRIAISLSDFEDILDVLAYDEAKSATEETFPVELVERLIEGESPLRVYREFRGFTQVQIAQKIGLTQATIAELEKGKQKGSIYTWKALASVLNVDIDDLV